MPDDQENSYEIHIVSYNNTKLHDLPNGYTRLPITDSQICLNEVTSFHHIENINEALEEFYRTVQWHSKIKQLGEMHIKLELVMDLAEIDNLIFCQDVKYPTIPKCLSYDDSYFIGGFGWDVHIDGKFSFKLKQLLLEQNWIFLNYLSDNDNNEYTTLTQHFLSERRCSEAYQKILDYLTASGGFSGLIYWENPIKYLISTTAEQTA